MQEIRNIGTPWWNTEDIINSLEEFTTLYEERPFKDNKGGMLSPHMFATYFITKQINPSHIIESGVWYGQGTWLFEKAAPSAKITCIDIHLRNIKYKSKNATYHNKDFLKQDWSNLDKDATLVFFDDHQNAFERLIFCKEKGFKHIIFEDNYPASQGDCYSLKKVLMEAGFTTDINNQSLFKRIRNYFSTHSANNKFIKPNSNDSKYLEENLRIYYEFPPIYKAKLTRWGDEWIDAVYPTPEPIFKTPPDKNYLRIFYDEAIYYTWLCYVRL